MLVNEKGRKCYVVMSIMPNGQPCVDRVLTNKSKLFAELKDCSFRLDNNTWARITSYSTFYRLMKGENDFTYSVDHKTIYGWVYTKNLQ